MNAIFHSTSTRPAGRGLDTAVVWSRSGGTYGRAADVLYLADRASSSSGQETDNRLNTARGYAAVILVPGEEPALHMDDPDDRRNLIAAPHVVGHHDPIQGVADALKDRGISGDVALVGSEFFQSRISRRCRRQRRASTGGFATILCAECDG